MEDNNKQVPRINNLLNNYLNEQALNAELKNLGLAANHTLLTSQIQKISSIRKMDDEIIQDYTEYNHLDDPFKRSGIHKSMIVELEECLKLVKAEI